MEPSAVPTTGGATPPAIPTSGDSSADGLFGGTGNTLSPVSPSGGDTSSGGYTTPPLSGGGIFGGEAALASKPRIALNNPPTSALNLIGKLEGWGIGPATPVVEVSIKVSAATGAQLKELLKKLPDGMTFELTLEKDDI
jgi:hypothetical protein